MTVALRNIAGLLLCCVPMHPLLTKAATAQAVMTARQTTAKLDYTIRYHPDTSPATLTITLTATGLPTAGRGITCRLDDWGEWTSASFTYVRNLRIDGRARSLDGKGAFTVPPALLADGRLEVSYDLVVQPQASPEHRQRDLLPSRTDHHVFAFVSNTIMAITVDSTPLAALVTIRVDAPPDQHVFTGWNGFSVGPQTGTAPATFPDGNGIFAIGKSFAFVSSDIDGTSLEIAQFTPGPDATGAIAEVARTIIPSFVRGTGRAPRGAVVRIFVETSRGGGTHTDLGLVVDFDGTLPLRDGWKDLLAHELFHNWLGSQLVDDGSLVWFSEGFTDYLALWHATATGLVTPQRFGERILDFEREARTESSLGRFAFAAPGVDWRDDDGPNETMAYKGGALLAFTVDAELRRRGGQTANAVVRGLLESPSREYHLGAIREVMTKLGVADVYDRSIAGTHMPDARPLLVALGFDDVVEQPALTYLGIEARYDGASDSTDVVPAVVTAIDSAGPASKASILPGDRITAYGVRRGNPPTLGPDAPARYRFGLSVIPSGARSVTLEVQRGGKPIQVDVAPVLTRGGRRVALRWNPDRRTGFFDAPAR